MSQERILANHVNQSDDESGFHALNTGSNGGNERYLLDFVPRSSVKDERYEQTTLDAVQGFDFQRLMTHAESVAWIMYFFQCVVERATYSKDIQEALRNVAVIESG